MAQAAVRLKAGIEIRGLLHDHHQILNKERLNVFLVMEKNILQ